MTFMSAEWVPSHYLLNKDMAQERQLESAAWGRKVFPDKSTTNLAWGVLG